MHFPRQIVIPHHLTFPRLVLFDGAVVVAQKEVMRVNVRIVNLIEDRLPALVYILRFSYLAHNILLQRSS